MNHKTNAVAGDVLYRALRALLMLCALIGVGGCASIFYAKTATGKFSGKLYVEWIAPNQFIYRPDELDPLVFVTSDGRRIQPRLMYTDGGSIPRLFWSAPNFGPWDFAPGYIVHDWLFEQHHCKTDDWVDYDFNASARILAEAMKSQMEKAGQPEPVVVYTVHEAVLSPIAARLWDGGACKPPPIAPQLAPGGVPPPPAAAPIRLLTIDIH